MDPCFLTLKHVPPSPHPTAPDRPRPPPPPLIHRINAARAAHSHGAQPDHKVPAGSNLNAQGESQNRLRASTPLSSTHTHTHTHTHLCRPSSPAPRAPRSSGARWSRSCSTSCPALTTPSGRPCLAPWRTSGSASGRAGWLWSCCLCASSRRVGGCLYGRHVCCSHSGVCSACLPESLVTFRDPL
jgi:hypothetical protein